MMVDARRVFPIALLIGCSAAMAWSEDKPPAVSADHAARMKQGQELFRRVIRPALVARCLKCHGGRWVKGDFDLSSRPLLIDSGMIEKTAADSHLMMLLRHEEEPHMPKDAPPLPPKLIASIGRWIDLGAPYDKPLVKHKDARGPLVVTDEDRQFWSFLPLTPGELPPADSWCRTKIDRYIVRRLREHRLTPNPIADKRTLLRRAVFDLTGLPPTQEQVAAFYNDDSPDGFSHLIDRLLESPHYGERWARHWMDVARFAESHGYEQDYDRPHAYHYRDFLIRALNDDLPYDQFVRWQLAGDELAPGNPLAMMATGFLGGGVFPTQLTEIEFESARYDELDDMTTTTGVAFLGLSVGCARCHDHKFDPIPTRDYYRLAATFTSTIRSEIDIDLDRDASQGARDKFEAELARRQAALKTYEQQQAAANFTRWLKQPVAVTSRWAMLDAKVQSSGGTNWKRQPDGSLLATGKAPNKEVVTLTADAPSRVAAVRLEALADSSLPRNGPGRADNGNFALGDIQVRLLHKGAEAQRLSLQSARATHQQNSGSLSVSASIDGDPISGWAVDAGGIGKDQAAVFDLQTPVSGRDCQIEVTLVFEHPNTRHAMGRIRLSTASRTGLKAEIGNSGPPAKVAAALTELRKSPDSQSKAWQTALPWFLQQDAQWLALKKQYDEHQKAGPQLKLAKVQVSSEGLPHVKHHADGRGYPHHYKQTHFLMRGDVNQKLEVAAPGFLQVLTAPDHEVEQWKVSPPAGDPKSFRRAALAGWITDPQHGAGRLVARVMVNRLWHHHFGVGLVATPNDFGFQGEPPSHPQLLDYLAQDLIDNGWRLKRVHKLIMTSAAYMQSSSEDAARRRLDPDNQWHWRRTPRRLEAEAIRDSMLAVSGQLDTTMYGPGTLNSNMKRRSVYFFIKRSKLISMMMLFDWPEHLVSIGRRANTTIAPQALMFMNSPQGRQYSLAFAGQLPEQRASAIEQAYQLALARDPSAAESELAAKFIAQQQASYERAGRKDGSQLARRDFCQALLSSNEFVYLD